MNTRTLLRWGDLEERRRRAARPVLLRSPWLVPVVGGAAVALAVAALLRGDDPDRFATASRAWLALALLVHTAVMLGAPFRLFWRHDGALLARLPLPGGALFDVAAIRGARASVRAVIVCAPALIVFGLEDWAWAARHAALLGALALASAGLVPATALAAGGLVASEKAQALGKSFGGEVQLSGTGWLGALPGLAMSAVVIVAILCVPWLGGATATAIGPGWLVVAGLGGAAVIAVAMARAAAPAVMPHALREVVALDRQQLAHLEIHPPTGIERAVARLLGPGARLVHGKDARLMRRRFPLAYVVGAVGTITLWIMAASRPEGLVVWSTAVAGALALYGVVLARRLGEAPIEQGITLIVLPIDPAATRAAKRAWFATWLLIYVGVGAVPVIARASAPLVCAAALIGVIAVGLGVGARAVRA
ncbi:MAG: hypothetical protein K8W52_47045 [Deltaproteobacteria bacterium]|nr:hypothetical protein [Deltaproteobacteria bacterium]